MANWLGQALLAEWLEQAPQKEVCLSKKSLMAERLEWAPQ